MLEDIKSEKFDKMDELHHLTSGFKAMFTQDGYDGLLQIRQALGGAGYSAWSGIPYLVSYASPGPTFEGDNTVMAIQSTNFIKKMIKQIKEGKQINHPIFCYLHDIPDMLKKQCSAASPEEFCSIKVVQEALLVQSSYLIDQTFAKMGESKASKKEKENFIFANDMLRMAQTHLRAVNFLIFR